MTPPVSAPVAEKTSINVTINGVSYEVPNTFSEVSLNEYLREHLLLTGTKVMCREGGCGACIVHVAFPDPAGSQQIVQKAVNSCLCPILSCDGWDVTTVEGIGDQVKPHAIQSKLTENYGTQCGYCTPGWVMNMYSLLQNSTGDSLTRERVEANFDGNLCRCTGYRPILDAFKSFASDSSTNGIRDIEDFKTPFCVEKGKICENGGHGRERPVYHEVKPLPASVNDFAPPWLKPKSLEELYKTVQQYTQRNVYYVVGHTGIGVYNDGPYEAYVDMKGVSELYKTDVQTDKVVFGANLPLNSLIDFLDKAGASSSKFAHLPKLSAIIKKTASVPVRNFGSWAGNLALKNRHKEFPSDTFVALTTGNTKIVTGPDEKSLSMEDFLQADMRQKIILRAEMPTFDDTYVFRTYKVMPRYQNAHACVNAGFRAKVDRSQTGHFVISEKPSLVFGNISAAFVHAENTETYLTGKDLGDAAILLEALKTLKAEIQPPEVPAEASPVYKQNLGCALFYKFALEIVGDAADFRNRSAVGVIERPLSSGTQSYQTRKEEWPLTQPIPKLESMVQCTGEAKYISDIDGPGFLHAEFVLTGQANAAIYRLDVADALAIPGVRRVLTAADIPGKNTVGQGDTPEHGDTEEFLATRRSSYAGQPVAIVIADTRELAEAGAKVVKIEYTGTQTPILTCQDAIREKSFHSKIPPVVVGDADKAVAAAAKTVSGELEIGAQTHYHMETMVAVTWPVEDGFDVEASTQYIDLVQGCISQVLGKPRNRINVTVKRNGGGFGAKIQRANHVAAASALGAAIMKRPVKMHLSLWHNSKSVGKRYAYYGKYKVGFDDTGRLLGVVCDVYCNTGAFDVRAAVAGWKSRGDNVYRCPNWKFNLYSCKTHLAPNTACRAPDGMRRARRRCTRALLFSKQLFTKLRVDFGTRGPANSSTLPNSYDNRVVWNSEPVLDLARANFSRPGADRSLSCFRTGSTEGIYFIEYMMEHVARALNKPPIEVKQLNYYVDGDKDMQGSLIKSSTIVPVTNLLLESSNYSARLADVKSFNQANRWRKRGLSIVPMRYGCSWSRKMYNCLVAVFHGDATVMVTHGGVELGQGINTKVAQVVAYELGIDMKYIVIKANSALTDANGSATGGSMTSELACLAAIDCCDQLKNRIKSIKDTLQKPTWEQTVEACFKKGVDLTTRALCAPESKDPVTYNTYGAMCTEVELDGLTGQYQINRLDLVYDCGESMSPFVDIGQVEGAVIMGLGYFTCEEVIYDEKTGENLTFGTWKYKIPSAKDIPVDFRITMLPNAPNPSGVLRSKIVAEPPLCMTSSVVFALRSAIEASRSELKDDTWFRMDAPITVERAQLYCLPNVENMVYKQRHLF